MLVALFALAAPRADPIIALVACWALLGIFVELSDPENLMNLGKFNFIDWPDLIINAVQQTALVLSLASGCASVIAVGRLAQNWNTSRVAKREACEAEI